MEKKLNKPYARNTRLDEPCGLLGTPPDGIPFMRKTNNVVIFARLTDGQIDELMDMLDAQRRSSLPQ